MVLIRSEHRKKGVLVMRNNTIWGHKREHRWRYVVVFLDPSVTNAAPSTFRHEGREPDFLCKCEPTPPRHWKPTFRRP